MKMELSSLARTLAERAYQEHKYFNSVDSIIMGRKDVEEIVREAIDKTLEAAARLMDERAADPYFDSHLAYTSGAEVIREMACSLKQSNSGMEVRK